MTVPSTGPIASATLTRSENGYDVLTFSNRSWLLEVALGPYINPRLLKHLPTGQVIADENYCYKLELASAENSATGFVGGPQTALGARLIDWGVEENGTEGTSTLTISARLDFGRHGPTDIVVEHSFTLLAESDRFDEQLALVHRFGHDSHTVADYRFGFRKQMFDASSGQWIDNLDEYRLGAVPFRRRRGQAKDFLKEDYSAMDLAPANWGGNNLPNRQSEAWSWQDGQNGFCFAKYSQQHLEFALVDGEFYTRPAEETPDGLTAHADVGDLCLRFGGAGRTHGAPGRPVTLNAESRTFRFGTSSIIPFSGDWEDGHRAYGAFLRGHGHVVPKGFNPPIHWNELYALSWRGGNNAPLQELPELWGEAERAQQMGAEAFYFDPVWDLFEGSSVWDTARLGPLPDFVARLRDEYGLSLSLHLMIHTKSSEEDPRIYRRLENGEIAHWKGRDYVGGFVCCASKVWQDHKTERLLQLARDGVSFFMFDFCEYLIEETKSGVVGHSSQEACVDPTHGHSVPMTLEDHAEGVVDVMKRVKREFPDLLIEAHDRVSAGLQDYSPLYYQHGLDEATFDEHWGFEYMWNPHMDLLSGKSLSLYEYNLAYDIPLYLHINLRFNNDNAVAFWWYASTCRHLGIGGLKPGDATWDSHLEAMQTYKRLKPHFAEGRFVGIDRMLHGHFLDEQKSAVFVAFNLTSRDKSFSRSIPLDKLGIDEDATISGRGVTLDGATVTLSAEMPALSAHVFEIKWP